MTPRQELARRLAQYDATGAELKRLVREVEANVGHDTVTANTFWKCETLNDESWNALMAKLSTAGRKLVVQMCPTRASLSESDDQEPKK